MIKTLFYLGLGGCATFLMPSAFAKGPVAAEKQVASASVVVEKVAPQKTSTKTEKLPEPAKKESVRATGKEIEIGKKPPVLIEDLSELSYILEKRVWNHKNLEQGKKISVLFYSSPDKKIKEWNSHVSEAISALKKSGDLPPEYFDSYAVVNVQASFWPSFLVSMKLKSVVAEKQKQYPTTQYIRDNRKHLVRSWGLEHKSNCVLLFDTDGTVLFRHDGKVPEKEKAKLIKIMKEKVQSLADLDKARKGAQVKKKEVLLPKAPVSKTKQAAA